MVTEARGSVRENESDRPTTVLGAETKQVVQRLDA